MPLNTYYNQQKANQRSEGRHFKFAFIAIPKENLSSLIRREDRARAELEGNPRRVATGFFITVKLIYVFCGVLVYSAPCTQCLAVSAAQRTLNRTLKTRGGGRRGWEMAV